MAKQKQDWHPADVQAALKKAGVTMKSVGERAKYTDPNSARHVLKISMPRVEAVIAEILGVCAAERKSATGAAA